MAKPTICTCIDSAMAKLAKGSESIWLKLAGPLVTAAGIIVSVLLFNSKNEQEGLTEFRRNRWSAQRANYERVANAVGNILAVQLYPDTLSFLADADTVLYDAAVREFRKIYLGAMLTENDPQLVSAMIRFKDKLGYYRGREEPYRQLVIWGKNLLDAQQKALDRQRHEVGQ